MINENKEKRISFSKGVKNELLKGAHSDLFLASWEIMALFLYCGHIINNKTVFSHLNRDCIVYFRDIINRITTQDSKVRYAGNGHAIEIPIDLLDYLHSEERYRCVVELFYGDSEKTEQTFIYNLKIFSPHQLEIGIRQFMRALFLVCGSMSNPLNAYHFSMSFRREEMALTTKRLLAEIDLPSKIIRKDDLFIVYSKESQFISDFLLNVGAHKAFLCFESLRVDKELRNNVNRVVNCDSANTQRIANTGARQAALISTIEKTGGLRSLPEELYEIALLRRDNPDLSLKELGEMAQPSLGKSGIYHRLKKIEKQLTDQIENNKMEIR